MVSIFYKFRFKSVVGALFIAMKFTAVLVAGVSAYEQEWAEFQAMQGARNGEIPQAFKENVDIVKEHNAAQSEYTLAWTGPFAAYSNAEYKATLTRKASSKSSSGSVPVLEAHTWDGEEVLSAVDWTTEGAVTGVKDQGSCGGCWSFAATGGLEGANFKATGQLAAMSEQQFLDCDSVDSGCGGGLEYQGWQFFKDQNQGICSEDSYPYKARNGNCKQSSCSLALAAGAISGITHVTASANSLMSALNQQPVSIGIQADQSSFQLYNSGILKSGCGNQLDHSVLSVGYQSGSYWKVKNSWGGSWGDSGYIRFSQTGDVCGILDDASYPIVSAATVV